MTDILDYCDKFKLYGSKQASKRDLVYPGLKNTTAHSSKGLEWDVCFVSWTGFYPMKLSGEDLEEKRRLCYVTMTRARRKLVVTSVYDAYGSKKNGHTPNKLFEELLTLNGRSFSQERYLDMKQEEMRKAEEKRAKEAEKQKEQHTA